MRSSRRLCLRRVRGAAGALDVKKMIHLIGPGGAGKTTSGVALAAHLKVPFVDLDAEFMAGNGDISAFIDLHGYQAYARRNVDSYLALLDEPKRPGVVALSSGFMVYEEKIHPEYAALRQRIACGELTFVLLPSLDEETCIAEIVRRQLQRPFARAPQREESVIRSRFSMYASLPARKVTTQRPVAAVVEEMMRLLPGNALQPMRISRG